MRLLAKGRAADVYDLGDGTVLRRYREAGADTQHEAAIMRQVGHAGFPVPAVVRATGADLVLERVGDRTMLEDLGRRPWRLAWHAQLLARLMSRLHAIPVVGGSVLHGDLHPGNVLLGSRGPVVIDWTNARIGPAVEDVAMTWLLLATSVPDGGAWQRRLVGLGQGYFTRRFLSSFELPPVRAALPEVARARLLDPNVTSVEAARVALLARL